MDKPPVQNLPQGSLEEKLEQFRTEFRLRKKREELFRSGDYIPRTREIPLGLDGLPCPPGGHLSSQVNS